jgi:hypothetical protein
MLNLLRKLYSLPFGFFGLIKFRFPSFVMVATESLKTSVLSNSSVVTIAGIFIAV